LSSLPDSAIAWCSRPSWGLCTPSTQCYFHLLFSTNPSHKLACSSLCCVLDTTCVGTLAQVLCEEYSLLVAEDMGDSKFVFSFFLSFWQRKGSELKALSLLDSHSINWTCPQLFFA
jgi:hypothetical protein